MGNFRKEAVAAARDGLNKSRAFCCVAQGLAEAADGVIEAIFELDECILGPKPILKLLSPDYLPGMLEKNQQHLQRLLVQFDSDTLLTQVSRRRIQFEQAETDPELW